VNKVKTLLSVGFFYIFAFVGCQTPYPIESFYKGKNSTLYFIKKTEFSGQDASAWVDFTFIKEDGQDTVTCNFTVESKDRFIERIDAAAFLAGNTEIGLSEISTLFIERSNHTARYTSRLHYTQFSLLFAENRPYLLLTSQGQTKQLQATADFAKTADAVRTDILSLPVR